MALLFGGGDGFWSVCCCDTQPVEFTENMQYGTERAVQCLERAQQRQKACADKSRRDVTYDVGTKTFAYCGQGGTGLTTELPLAQACTHYDMVMLGFLDIFGNGKPVILSIGGGVVNYGLSSTADAQSAASQIWNVYLGGTSSARPFGTSILDGVDLDIEEPSTGSQFYPDFVDKLTSLWSGASKKYYLTAVPQCPFPDAQLGTALNDNALVSSYQQWAGLISAAKVVPTFPAANAAAGSGYIAPSATAQALRDTTTTNFGLFSLGPCFAGLYTNQHQYFTFSLSHHSWVTTPTPSKWHHPLTHLHHCFSLRLPDRHIKRHLLPEQDTAVLC
ncbi:hypothetical protein WJX82_000293 [Trebouxia sp. C0006]